MIYNSALIECMIRYYSQSRQPGRRPLHQTTTKSQLFFRANVYFQHSYVDCTSLNSLATQPSPSNFNPFSSIWCSATIWRPKKRRTWFRTMKRSCSLLYLLPKFSASRVRTILLISWTVINFCSEYLCQKQLPCRLCMHEGAEELIASGSITALECLPLKSGSQQLHAL